MSRPGLDESVAIPDILMSPKSWGGEYNGTLFGIARLIFYMLSIGHQRLLICVLPRPLSCPALRKLASIAADLDRRVLITDRQCSR